MKAVKFNEDLMNFLQHTLNCHEAGKISDEDFKGRLSVACQIGKGLERSLKYKLIEIKTKEQMEIGIPFLLPMNRAEELIKCTVQKDLLISRNDCLEFSGDAKNHKACIKCNYYKENRKMLLPE